jgi:hypothetical protein
MDVNLRRAITDAEAVAADMASCGLSSPATDALDALLRAIKNDRATVYVVVTGGGDPEDIEILDAVPTWDLSEQDQVCYQGNVNGGDSVRITGPGETRTTA